jgi:preprotein translocase subunit SecG
MTSVLFIVQIILVISIVILVLLQKFQSMGLGAYSSSNESVFGAKGPMNFLAKLTLTLGFLLVLNTLTLTYLYNKQANTSVVNEVQIKKTATIPPAPIK